MNFQTFGTAYPNVPKQKNGYEFIEMSIVFCDFYTVCLFLFVVLICKICFRSFYSCSNDCGIFSMKYLELYCARNPAQCCFSQLDMPAFRVKYAHDIIMSDYNFEEDAKILVTGFNP
jgi:hypothetical protein